MSSEKTHIGISERDVVDEVEARRARTPAARIPPREVADPLLVGVDDSGREALVDDRPQAGVGRRVDVEHRLARLDLLGRQVLRATCRRAPRSTSRQSFEAATTSS